MKRPKRKKAKHKMLVQWPKPETYEQAVGMQTWYYDYSAHTIDPQVLADKLNAYFTETEGWEVDCFRPGKPREAGEMAVAIKWPKWRKERKPIKMALQAGILIEL